MKNSYLILETLADLLKNNSSLHDSLTIINELFPYSNASKVQELIKEGQSLTASFKLFTKDQLFIEFFDFYLQTSSVHEAIEKALIISQKKSQLKNTLVKSLIYPSMLILGILFFSIVATFFIQPQFNNFMMSFNIQRTILNTIVLNMLFCMPIILCLSIVIIIGWSIYFIYFLKSNKFTQIKWWLKIPLFKQCLQKYISLKFCLFYKELIYLNNDLKTITEILHNKVEDELIKMIIYEIKQELIQGKHIEHIIVHQDIFEDYFKLIFKLSLHHSYPYQMLNQYYTTTLNLIDLRLKQFISFLVTSIYAFVGIYVVGIYLGMIVPMMGMIDNF